MERRIAPTRTNLMRARQELKIATEGHQLLDQKREVLVLELLKHLSSYRDHARMCRKKLMEGYRAFADAEFVLGEERMEAIVSGPIKTAELSAVERSVMGVAVPSITEFKPGMGPEGGLADSVAELDEAVLRLKEAIPDIAKWAELGLAVYRLAAEVSKTQRRVNALREVFIPNLRRRITEITAALEEGEREEFFRHKRVKAKLRRQESANTAPVSGR